MEEDREAIIKFFLNTGSSQSMIGEHAYDLLNRFRNFLLHSSQRREEGSELTGLELLNLNIEMSSTYFNIKNIDQEYIQELISKIKE